VALLILCGQRYPQLLTIPARSIPYGELSNFGKAGQQPTENV
jgi:hypothetical protein